MKTGIEHLVGSVGSARADGSRADHGRHHKARQ
jgi:hypothetical protein